MTKQMPKTLLQLIEHIELNESGWWDSALKNVLLATIWMNGKPVPKGASSRPRNLCVQPRDSSRQSGYWNRTFDGIETAYRNRQRPNRTN